MLSSSTDKSFLGQTIESIVISIIMATIAAIFSISYFSAINKKGHYPCRSRDNVLSLYSFTFYDMPKTPILQNAKKGNTNRPSKQSFFRISSFTFRSSADYKQHPVTGKIQASIPTYCPPKLSAHIRLPGE